jgi:hypothetical protein
MPSTTIGSTSPGSWKSFGVRRVSDESAPDRAVPRLAQPVSAQTPRPLLPRGRGVDLI